ncbi:MAG: ABC transporter permease [Chitinophagaceae bacterium]|nr:ABC transporter permease [Chitinophagaceae bacterium]MCW5926721.1 ABC transporter permease [Chitinophagaceae bacterium]
MFRSYLKVALRSLVKNRIYSFVNIIGLAIGMAACFFVLLYVYFESGYDRFHTNASRIYRVPISMTAIRTDGDSGIPPDGHLATNHPAVGIAMKRDFPEVTSYTRMLNFSVFANKYAVSSEQPGAERRVFNESRVFLVDSSFFNVFSFPLVKGNRQHCLAEPNTIVISQSVARKYFGNSDPLNQVLTLNGFVPWANKGVFPFKVTGVFEDVPENSHIKFDMLISFETFPYDWLTNNWAWPEFYNYVLLAPGTDVKKLEAKFPDFIEKYLGTSMKQFNFRADFHLQPITDIHLKSRYQMEAEVNGSEREVYFLSVIGIFILLIAWINYVNISTAKSMERAKEVGVRKVAGAKKPQLIVQFLLESFIINTLALAASLVIIAACMPFFARLVGKNIGMGYFWSGPASQPMFWVAAVGLFVAGAFLVGAYPAFVLSSFKPVRVLKGLIIKSSSGISLRRVLVSFQFFLSIMLIAATLVVFIQLRFMRNGDLGYTKDQVMIIKAPAVTDSTLSMRHGFFKSETSKMSFVNNVAVTSDIPGEVIRYQNHVWQATKDKQSGFMTSLMEIDQDFLGTYKIELLAGRNFLASDSSNLFIPGRFHNVLINEKTSALLGFKSPEDAVNKDIIFAFAVGTVPARVLGVVKNYHQRSLKEEYDPILYFFPSWTGWKYMSVNLNTDHLYNHLSIVESAYKQAFPGNPFEYFFQDDFFNRQYQADQRLGDVFGVFTFLAILVAILGLLGLSGFVIRLRVKEIGIRKVLGASIPGILVLISKDFVKLVCFATAIAIPVVYWAADNWLNNFAFHIGLSWYIFMIPPLVLLLIVLFTVCLQSLKAALLNPGKSLRTE